MKTRLDVLIACEESQAVCREFRALGHRAFSCDIKPCSGGHPEWHIKGDALSVANGGCAFRTLDGREHRVHGAWDILIAHPPCTYLSSVQANRYYVSKFSEDYVAKRKERRAEGFAFFLRFARTTCRHVCIENPVGYPCRHFRKPDQIIQPFLFGDPISKRTALWLVGLPALVPTKIVPPEKNFAIGFREVNSEIIERRVSPWFHSAFAKHGFGDPEARRAERSKTFPGIARAMASQWSAHVLKEVKNDEV